MKRILLLWLPLALACSAPAKQSFPPSQQFSDRPFAVMMIQAPQGIPFYVETLNRLVRRWSDFSPGFRDNLVGISQVTPRTSGLENVLDSLESDLRTRAKLLVVLQPKFFRWKDKGHKTPRGAHDSYEGPLEDQADFLVSLIDLDQEKNLGSFPVRVINLNPREEPILEKLAYHIALKAGFGWNLQP